MEHTQYLFQYFGMLPHDAIVGNEGLVVGDPGAQKKLKNRHPGGDE